MPDSNSCRLCQGQKIFQYYCLEGPSIIFYRCSDCDLVFKDESVFLTSDLEKSRYVEHKNHIRDQGYIDFLDRLLDPICTFIKKEDLGLDFGSGPYPMLCEVMQERGHNIIGHDPLFSSSPAVFEKIYDYMTCSEVVEHFYYPDKSFQQMNELLRPGGIIGIMTGILYPNIDFSKWYYYRDETHVCFYTPKTMDYIAKKFNWSVIKQSTNVYIFRKNKF